MTTMLDRFLTELWTEYGIGMSFFFFRFFARFKVVGIGGLSWDDFFSFVAMLLWTADATMVHVIAHHGSNAGLNEESAAALTDAEAARLEIGSKLVFVGWITYSTLVWSLKASLLCFYSRLTLGLWQQKFVRYMGIASVVAYLTVILTIFSHCTPIQKNWQIRPYAGDKCAINVVSYIVVAALNIITDAGILAIPLPLVWKVKIPTRRKIVIALLLSSGVFVIAAALLRCILTLSNTSKINNSTIWAVRETFVSLIAVSAPAIKPLFNKNTWIGSSYQNTATRIGESTHAGKNNTSGNSGARDTETGKEWDGNGSVSDVELKNMSRHGSEEYIIGKDDKQSGLVINVTTAYTLSEGTEEGVVTTREEDRDHLAGRTAPREGTNRVNMGVWGQRGGSSRAEVIAGSKK